MGAQNSTANRLASSKDKTGLSRSEQLHALYSKFHFECRSCHTLFTYNEVNSNVWPWFVSPGIFRPDVQSQISKIRCKVCTTSTCLGCGERPTLNKTTVVTSIGSLNHCCEGARLLGIWLILCHFDQKELELRVASNNSKKQDEANLPKDSGVGYEAGYASAGYKTSAPPPAPTHEHSDSLIASVLALLEGFLPDVELASASPAEDLNELLLFQTSFLMDRICALIRNDSIKEITERSTLYHSLFSFVESIAENPKLIRLLFEQQPNRKKSPGLRALSIGEMKQGFHDLRDLSPSLFTCFSNTYRQAKVFLELTEKDAEANYQGKRPSSHPKGQDPIDICNRIIKLYCSLEAQCESLDNSIRSMEGFKSPWTKFAEENRVTFTDEVLENHRFAKMFRSLTSTTKDRMLAIGKEISNMTTSLPDGVFVKVAESRSDVMKVLIIGVEGSPYAGGLFNFDMVLPSNYPHSPPKIAFVLQGVDSESPAMNPNLHHGGDVCLSILNTWPGDPSQMWQPNQSTILAVLVSIQAMILGAPLPWLNEPSFTDDDENPQAFQHKMQIQIKTVRHAMIGWLIKMKGPNPKSNASPWFDIIEKYWEYNSQKVIDTVEEWAVENPWLNDYTKSQITMMGFLPTEPPQERVPIMKTSVDLVQRLQQLLLMETDEEENSSDHNKSVSSDDSALSTIEELDESGSNKENNGGVGKGKRKADDDISKDSKKHKAKESKRQKTVKWVYTSGQTRKDVRAACEALNIKPSRGIDDTIRRLQERVNIDTEKMHSEVALKYGKLVSSSLESDEDDDDDSADDADILP